MICSIRDRLSEYTDAETGNIGIRKGEMSMRHYNIPIFVPHRGCPHDCAFCNQKQITAAQTEPDAVQTKQIVETALATIPQDSEVEVAFFGGSFTGIPIETQRALLEAVQPYREMGRVQGIRLSTRPDYINEEILHMLREYHVTSIELGVQSMRDAVLQKNGRGHTAQQVHIASRLIQKMGFSLGLQMMVGLDGSTEADEIYTAQEIAALKPDTVRIYPTIVLPQTELMRRYELGIYRPMELEPCVALCAKLAELFETNHIKIIRMGLQSTELIQETGDLVGPYHSSFGELVYIRKFRDKIETLVKDVQEKTVYLRVHPKDISRAVGNRKSTLQYFAEVYHKTLCFHQDDWQTRGTVKIF